MYFGIAITTRNRPEILADTLAAFARHTPPDVPVLVIDDASSVPVPHAAHRFARNRGIAAAKNKGMELLAAAGVEHLFLFDDDTRPCADRWWDPYVVSNEPHLMHNFTHWANGEPVGDDRVWFDDGVHRAHVAPRGCMLYAHRGVLDAVGGMDTAFGQWGYEHGDWSNRIHAAGLTTWRYGDVCGSEGLIHSLDRHVHLNGGHARTVPAETRQALLGPNKARHDAQRDQALYREYRDVPPPGTRDVVLTAYFSGVYDPQRGRAWRTDVAELIPLFESLRGRDVQVIHNDLPETVPGIRVGGIHSPYFDRWRFYYGWLRAHPEVRYAWCVDATDVVCLRDPFSDLRAGVLYVGSELATVGIDWMRKHHPEYAGWIDQHRDEQLLNCGLVGGDRATVMALCQRMMREYGDRAIAGCTPTLDMGAFNVAARAFQYETGSRIHTVFRRFDRGNTTAMWAHK
ncbi:MAG TPA: glycosyltransferase [Luteimonas sp.]|nr:glycosyltransferase [Luteimonas sp.]